MSRQRWPIAWLMTLILLLLPAAAVARDTDGDGLRDAFERKHGLTSPRVADSDGDGVVDAAEDPDDDDLSNRGEQRFGTDPRSPDTDGDGLLDGQEDDDQDGRPNARDQHQRPVPAGVRPPLELAADDISVHARRCGVRSGEPEVNRCHFGDQRSKTRVVLMGDSKATMYLPPAMELAEQEGWHLITLLKGRCTPILGTMTRYQRLYDDGDSCRQWRRDALDWLRRRQPDMILMVFSDDYILVDSAGRQLKGSRQVEALRQGMARTMAQMPAESKVVLLADSPKQRRNPVKCLRDDPRDMSACVTGATPPEAGHLDAVLRQEIEASGGHYRSLRDQICPYEPCPLVQGDTLVYRDKGHLTVSFTELLTPALRDQLAPLLEPDEEVVPIEPMGESASFEPSSAPSEEPA